MQESRRRERYAACCVLRKFGVYVARIEISAVPGMEHDASLGDGAGRGPRTPSWWSSKYCWVANAASLPKMRLTPTAFRKTCAYIAVTPVPLGPGIALVTSIIPLTIYKCEYHTRGGRHEVRDVRAEPVGTIEPMKMAAVSRLTNFSFDWYPLFTPVSKKSHPNCTTRVTTAGSSKS